MKEKHTAVWRRRRKKCKGPIVKYFMFRRELFYNKKAAVTRYFYGSQQALSLAVMQAPSDRTSPCGNLPVLFWRFFRGLRYLFHVLVHGCQLVEALVPAVDQGTGGDMKFLLQRRPAILLKIMLSDHFGLLGRKLGNIELQFLHFPPDIEQFLGDFKRCIPVEAFGFILKLKGNPHGFVRYITS